MDDNGGNSIPLLPQDLITTILLRLPVKSLMRFQCVCKEWKSLFKTQSFIKEHLHHSSHQNPFLFFQSHSFSRTYRAYLVNSEMKMVGLHNHPLIQPHWYVRSNTHYCNGLLCLHLCDGDENDYYSLWNPATRESILISKDYNSYAQWSIGVGFGFSSIVNDYKIVNICHSWIHDNVTIVEVYSLNAGTWKTVEHAKLDGLHITSQGFAFNGAIFWIGLKIAFMEDEQNGGVIVSFDVATEEFTLIPMPPLPSSIYDEEYEKCLTVYENKLAVLSNTLSEDFKSSLIHLWVMEDEGTSTSEERWCWTKKYSSNPYRGYFLEPVCIWKNEIVSYVYRLPIPVEQDEDEFAPNGERKIVMFNFTTNEFRTFDFPQFLRGYCSFTYAESLVPLGNIHIEQV